MEWESWQYKNLTILFFSFLLSLALGSFKPFHEFLFTAGYWSAFLAGVIFVFTFSAPIAAVILLILAEKLPIFLVLVAASFGAILSDFTIFRLFKDGLAEEIEPLYENLGKNHFKHILRTKHFRRLLPVIGAIIILTPLPDDVGINLMGIHKLKNQQFLVLSALVNVVGIIFILLLSFVIKP